MRTPADVAAALDITPDTVAVRRTAIDLTDADRMVLGQAAAGAAAIREGFLDFLYARLREFPDAAVLLTSEAQVARLKAQQRDYLDELFAAPLTWDYVLRRLWVGVVHHRVRLSPQWYLTTYAHVICEHLPGLFAAAPPAVAMAQAVALIKAAFFDASLGLDAYGRVVDADQLQQGRASEPAPHVGAPTDASPARPRTAPPSPARLRLDEADADARRRYLGFDAATLEDLRTWAPLIAARTPAVLDEFYAFLGAQPETARLVPAEVAERLKRQVASYWRELGEGAFDQGYAASRMRIGVIHERIGLGPSWYLAGLARQIAGFARALDPAHPEVVPRLQALVRAVCFDVSFVIDAYMDARADRLLALEGYARQLVAGLASAVAIVDAHGRLVSANRTMVQIAGGDAAVLYLLPLDRALPLPEAATLVTALRAQLASGGSPRLTADARHGGRRLRLTAVALSGEPGLEGAVALVVDDVTDIVRMAGDIDAEHSQLEVVADGVGVVLWEMDPATCTITAINRAAIDVTGWRDVAFLGVPFAWPQRVADIDRERVATWLRTLDAGAAAATIDYRWPTTDGRERWLRTRARRTGEGPARLLGVTTDITAERQRDQLRLDALMTTAGGVAHVVNNCLTAVIGGIELHALGAGAVARSPELEAALDATRKAATMASRLLAFAGRQRLLVETLSLGDVVHERLPGLTAIAGTRALTVDVGAAAWACRVDRRLLGSALDALVHNACEATPDGGVVRIATRNVPAYAVPGDADAQGADWVELEVADEGAGMSDEVRRRAFEPFFSTRDLAEASGLGLSMVYGFVAQSAGHVRLESTPGRGTTIRLRFPRAAVDGPVAGQPATRVLVVEDDDNVRVVTAAMVRALGGRVSQAASGAEALAVAAAEPLDVLVCDVVLGHGVDGVELARTLLERQPSLAVVLVSGFPRSSFDLGTLPPGVVFLTKPLGLAALGEAIGVARRERA